MSINKSTFLSVQQIVLAIIFLVFTSGQVIAAHRMMMPNTVGWERTKERWPNIAEATDMVNNGVIDAGKRHILKETTVKRELNLRWIEIPTPMQFAEGVKSTAFDSSIWDTGTTQISTRLDTNDQVTGYYGLLREEGRVPYRFSWNMWQHALPSISAEVSKALYETIGFMVGNGIEYNEWIWLLGAGSEGDGDSVTRACLGPDIPALPGKEDFVKNQLEQCPAWIKGDFENMGPTGEGMLRALNAGWRFVGMHGIGSHLIRLFVERLEDAMAKNPDLTLERVRSMRHGFSHGTMLGKVPDVIDMAIKYNLYLPIDVERSLTDETEAIPEFYGPEGFEFLSPVKSLLDAGVKVMSDTGGGSLHDVEVFVTRIHPHTGEVFNPEERVDRVTSLKLHTIAPAEFAFAETRTGSLGVGKLADFMVIDKNFLDPVQVPDTEIGDIQVYMTVIGGATVWTNEMAPAEFKQLPHVYGRQFELGRKANYQLGSTP